MTPPSNTYAAVQVMPRALQSTIRALLLVFGLLLAVWALREALADASRPAAPAESRWQPHRMKAEEMTNSSLQAQHLQQQQQQQQRHQAWKQQHEQHLQMLQQLLQQQQQVQATAERLAHLGHRLEQTEHVRMAAVRPTLARNAVQSHRQSVLPVSCTSLGFSKQSCLFQDVCLQSTADKKAISAVLRARVQPAHADILKQHLVKAFEGLVGVANITVAINPAGNSVVTAGEIQPPTIIWRPVGANQYSFGHALINEALSAFLVLQNHFRHIPDNLRMLTVGGWHSVLSHVVTGTITSHAADIDAAVAASPAATCFSQLLVGDGGYIAASRGSLAGTGTTFSTDPSFFSSANWWNFKQHAMRIHGVQEEHPAKPLILLNDKRYGDSQDDRRMLLDIEHLVGNISALYPAAEVRAVRFRDLNIAEQIRWLSRAKVFITTQGSSAFRLVFLPQGATCVFVGSPSGNGTKWVSFFELDRWFPLTYVQFKRYEVALNSTAEYEVKPMPGQWQPSDPAEAHEWWLYNANVRLQMDRLKVILDPVMQAVLR